MAYCTKCGRALQDGEVCSCQTATQSPVTPIQSTETAAQESVIAAQESVETAQLSSAASQESVSPAQASPAPAQASTTPYQASAAPVQASVVVQPVQPNALVEFFKLLWTIVLGVLKTPVTSISTFVEKADLKVACALIGLHALVAALITWFELLQRNSKLYAIDYNDFNSIMDQINRTSSHFSAGYIFKQVCCSALYIIAAAAVVALVIMLTVNTISKTKTTYVQGLAIASLTAILLIPAAIFAYIFGLIDVVFFQRLASWVTAFASAASAIYVFFGVRVLCKDENKLPMLAGLCAVGSAIAIYLISMMFS